MLLVGLAAILAVATLLESANGREYALWHVYKNAWFMALLGLLALNILAAMLVRFPWRWRHLWVFAGPCRGAGVLAGAFVTFLTGVEGQLVLEEGQSGDRLVMADRDQACYHSRPNTTRESVRFSPSIRDRQTGRNTRSCDSVRPAA